MKNINNWKNDKYYYFPDDLNAYPDAWCYVVWSRRGAGKTYSALRYAYENEIKIAYMKRTIDDVTMICSGAEKGINLSPYVPISRDANIPIQAKLIGKGIGGFYDKFTDEGKPEGVPFSYCASLNAMKTIKGFDLSICDWMILDEFIPQSGEIVKKKEGEMLLDVYMTIARDRIKRGRKDLKLILFANAENISTPITYELDIVDDMINLQASGKSHYYIEDRGIVLHRIIDDEIALGEDEESGIYKAMKNTAWGMKAFGGEFSNNDFSNVGKVNLKQFHPVTGWTYKNKNCYVYMKDGYYFFTDSRADVKLYNLNHENDQKKFYYDYVLDLRVDCYEGKCTFKSYTYYDILMNYKHFFKL